MKLHQIFIFLLSFKHALAFDCTGKTRKLIADFFDQHALSVGVAYLCCYKNNLMEFQKFLIQSHLRIKVFNVENYDFNVDDLTHRYGSLGIVVDLHCQRSDWIIEKAYFWNLFNVSYHWLVFDEVDASRDIFKDQFLRLDSNVWIASQSPNFSWSLHEVYNPGYYQGGFLHVNHLGFWNSQNGFRLIQNESRLITRKNFGISLKTITWEQFPANSHRFDVVNYDEIQRLGNFRMHLNLIEILGELYNFSINIGTIPNSEYENQTSNSLIKALTSGEYDVSASGILPQSNQISSLAMTAFPSWKIRSHFFFRHPKTSDTNTFLSPMENSAWYVTLFTCILMMVLLRIIIWYEKYYFKAEGYDQPDDASFGYLLLLTLGAATQQSSSQISLLPSGRLVTCVLNVFSLIVFQFYSASIVANLLLVAPKSITTLKDLSDSALDVGIADNSFLLDLFPITNDGIELELYKGKIKGNEHRPDQIYSLEQGIDKLENGGFAFHVEDTTFFKVVAEVWSDKEVCDIAAIQMRPPQLLFIPLPKNSSFLEFWNVGLLKMLERGILNRNLRFWSVEKPDCLQESTIEDYIVAMEEIYSCFVVLGVGIVLGWIIFVMEIVLYLYKTRFKEKVKGIK